MVISWPISLPSGTNQPLSRDLAGLRCLLQEEDVHLLKYSMRPEAAHLPPRHSASLQPSCAHAPSCSTEQGMCQAPLPRSAHAQGLTLRHGRRQRHGCASHRVSLADITTQAMALNPRLMSQPFWMPLEAIFCPAACYNGMCS